MASYQSENRFKRGFRDGLPIGLGYLSVSFTFGILAVKTGISVPAAILISMTTFTSAGQFAGITSIATGGPLIELALTQLIINIRYSLMSLFISQKADKTINILHRFLIPFGITDENFAIAASKRTDVGRRYMYGLISMPYVGWATGTAAGAGIGTILPESVRSALGIALYGMFLAIVVPPAKKNRAVAMVLLLSVLISLILRYAPLINRISSGYAIIICAVVASTVGAWLYPIKEVEG